MLIVISPSKTLNIEVDSPSDFHTTPLYLNQSQKLVNVLKKKNTPGLKFIKKEWGENLR